MRFITNAFSLQMIKNLPKKFQITELDVEKVKEILKKPFFSAVGHSTTANVLSKELGTVIPFNRTNLVLDEGDELIVAQYSGGRLPEGTYSLPEGAEFKFIKVELI